MLACPFLSCLSATTPRWWSYRAFAAAPALREPLVRPRPRSRSDGLDLGSRGGEEGRDAAAQEDSSGDHDHSNDRNHDAVLGQGLTVRATQLGGQSAYYSCDD